MNWTVFMLVRTTPAWLELDRCSRAQIAEAAVTSALQGLDVAIRFFDAEALSGRCTDVVVFETESIEAYYFAIERLRDSALFTVPYFEIADIIPAIEGGFQAFEAFERTRRNDPPREGVDAG